MRAWARWAVVLTVFIGAPSQGDEILTNADVLALLDAGLGGVLAGVGEAFRWL